MYAMTNHQNETTTIKRGNVYIANVNRVIAKNDSITEELGKSNLHKMGSLSIRPVLVIREPEPWDKYMSTTVIPASSKEIQGIVIEKSKEFDNVANDRDSYRFKVHDLRTISACALTKYVASVPEHIVDLLALLSHAMVTASSFDVVHTLRSLKSAMLGYPQYLEDIKSIYVHLYQRFVSTVIREAPELVPDFEVQKGEDAHHGILPRIYTHPNLFNTQIFPNHHIVHTPETEPDEEPSQNVESEPNVPVAKDEPTPETPKEPEPEIKVTADKSFKDNLINDWFRPSTLDRDWKEVEVTRRSLITPKFVYGMCAAQFLSNQAGAEILDKSAYAFSNAMKEYTSTQSPYFLTSTIYSAFMSWYTNRFQKMDSNFVPREIFEGMFPLISEHIVEDLPDKIDFKEAEYKKDLKELGVTHYAELPERVRSVYYSMTRAEVYEFTPCLTIKTSAKLYHLQFAMAGKLLELCKLARKINGIVEPEIENEDETETPAPVAQESKKIETPRTIPDITITDDDWRKTVLSIRAFLTPANMRNMPPKLQEVFLVIPRKYVQDYCLSLPGWNKEVFDTEYKSVYRYFQVMAKNSERKSQTKN